MLAVAASARASAALPKEEVTLSRGLHTPPLPATHAPVGYRWQNSECCQPLRGRSTVTSTTLCRTRAMQECLRLPSPGHQQSGGGDAEALSAAQLNPRRHIWSRHFRWEDGYLVGRTAIGRVTIERLKVNDPCRVRLRE